MQEVYQPRHAGESAAPAESAYVPRHAAPAVATATENGESHE